MSLYRGDGVSLYRGDDVCHSTEEMMYVTVQRGHIHTCSTCVRTLVSKPDVFPIMCTGQNT